jgi:hypothetical protein
MSARDGDDQEIGITEAGEKAPEVPRKLIHCTPLVAVIQFCAWRVDRRVELSNGDLNYTARSYGGVYV